MSETTANARLILHPDDNQIFECMHFSLVYASLSPHLVLTGFWVHLLTPIASPSLHQRYMRAFCVSELHLPRNLTSYRLNSLMTASMMHHQSRNIRSPSSDPTEDWQANRQAN